MDEMNKVSEELLRIAKQLIAMPTIWDTRPYKVSAYPDEAEGKHKEKHVAVQVSNGEEQGSVSLKDGSCLIGNLSSKTLKWCRDVLFAGDNRKRILQMILTKTFYRLDKPNEVKQHPLQTEKPKTKNARRELENKQWFEQMVESVEALGPFFLKLKFKDGLTGFCDFKKEAERLAPMFDPMLKNPSLVYDVKLDSGGMAVYWDDIMDFSHEWLYRHSIKYRLDED